MKNVSNNVKHVYNLGLVANEARLKFVANNRVFTRLLDHHTLNFAAFSKFSNQRSHLPLPLSDITTAMESELKLVTGALVLTVFLFVAVIFMEILFAAVSFLALICVGLVLVALILRLIVVMLELATDYLQSTRTESNPSVIYVIY